MASLLSSSRKIVNIDQLKRWHLTTPIEELSEFEPSSSVVVRSAVSAVNDDGNGSTPPVIKGGLPNTFPFNEKLNQKLILWLGDLVSLSVDMIVNSTNEKMDSTDDISGQVFEAAGPELMEEIANGTIRRFLEKYGEGISTVVLCMQTPEDLAVYEEILPIYFPRSVAEQRRVVPLIPEDIGNESGETVIPDRQIRIGLVGGRLSAGPGHKEAADSSLSSSGSSSRPLDPPDPQFADLKSNPDDIPVTQQVGKTAKELEREEIERVYKLYVHKAKHEDLSDLAQLDFIYQAGVDSQNRPVVVFVASRLPAQNADMERVLLYLILFLDPVVEQDYVMIYLHTDLASTNRPDFAWIKKAHSIFNRKYKKNMKRLLIVHPSWWVRLLLYVALRFVSEKFAKKITYVMNIHTELFSEFDAKQLKVPPHVYAYDLKTNGPAPAPAPAPIGASPSPTDTDVVVDAEVPSSPVAPIVPPAPVPAPSVSATAAD